MNYDKVWEVMNDLEMVTSKICSARGILDSAIDAHEEHRHEKVEKLLYAVDEYLQYYLQEFDEKFKKAWNETVIKCKEENPCMPPWGHSDMEYLANQSKIKSCDKDDPSPECQGAWNDFWEENYYPEEYNQNKEEKEKSREYNLREAEYYNKRTELDAISRNDSSRIEYGGGWIYESPDGGETVTKRKIGSTEKTVVKGGKVKKWILPVEEVRDEDTDEDIYCVTFPDDLLEAANLKEGDQVEWVDLGEGSYRLEKVVKTIGMDEC